MKGTALTGYRASVVISDDIGFNHGTDQPLTMSSREIAELLGSRHDHVKVSVERLAAKGIFACPATRDVQEIGGNNRVYTTTEYLLDKRSSLIIVAQLSPEFTARVVDRWQELEAHAVSRRPVPYAPKTQVEAALIRIAEEQEQRAIAAEAFIEEEFSWVTVGEFVRQNNASNFRRFGLTNQKLGQQAKVLGLLAKDPPRKELQEYTDEFGDTYVNELNVHRRDFLIQVCERFGIKAK